MVKKSASVRSRGKLRDALRHDVANQKRSRATDVYSNARRERIQLESKHSSSALERGTGDTRTVKTDEAGTHKGGQ